MASSSIKIALEMTGVQAYANATERAAQANEKLAERSKKSIAGIMSSTQRMVDMATKSKEQMTLEKLSASGASPDQIEQVKARFAQVEQVRAAEKAAAAAKAAEEQRAKEQAMALAAAAKAAEMERIAAIKEEARAQMEAARQSAEMRRVAEAASLVQAKELAASQAAAAKEAAEARRAAEVAAAQKAKETQVKIHKQLMAEKAAAEQKYERTKQYADSTKSEPMFGKTLRPLLKGFVGFKAVELGLSAMANTLDQFANGGKVDKLKVYSDTVIGLVKGLPAGDILMNLAKGVSALTGWGGNPEAIDAQTKAIEAQTLAMSKRLTAEESFRQKMEQIRRDREKVGKSDDEVARLDRESQLADQRKQLVGNGMSGQDADKRVAQLRSAMVDLQEAQKSAANAQQARQLDPALFTSMLEEQQQAADQLIGTERELYFSKVNRLVVERKITEDQENQLRAAFDRTQAARAEADAKKAAESKAKQQATDAQQFMDQLQQSYDQQMLGEDQLFQKKLKGLALSAAQVEQANRLHEAMSRQTKEAEARSAVERMNGFSNVESVNTAIGGVKVAGMTSFSLERMMPTQDAIRLAVQQIAKNTAPLAAGAP